MFIHIELHKNNTFHSDNGFDISYLPLSFFQNIYFGYENIYSGQESRIIYQVARKFGMKLYFMFQKFKVSVEYENMFQAPRNILRSCLKIGHQVLLLLAQNSPSLGFLYYFDDIIAKFTMAQYNGFKATGQAA